MTLKSCLRCDWQGESEEPKCPNCGERPLYVVGAPPSAGAGVPVQSHPRERSREAASTPSVAPVRHPAPSVEPSPSSTDAVEPSGRSGRSAVAFTVAALVLTVTLGTWLKAHEERSASAASTGGSPAPAVSPSATPPTDPSPTPDVDPFVEPRPTRRHVNTVDGVPFSFSVPAGSWEHFGSISINKSETGGQSAEAIVYWSSFPDGDYDDPYGHYAHPCNRLLSPPVGPSAADLAAAVSRAPGTELVTGPSNVTVGGYPAIHVVLTVRKKNVGCDPGFFYTWQDVFGGALWPRTVVGATMRVWIVDVNGTRLFIAAATTPQASSGLDKETQQIVASIRFGAKVKTDEMLEIAERFMDARNAYDAETAMSMLADGEVTAQLQSDNWMSSGMFGVQLSHDELALAFEAERLYGVRYESFGCRREDFRLEGNGGSANVVCKYSMDSRMRQLAGWPPVDSAFGLGIHGGKIDVLSFPWLNISWGPDGYHPAEFQRFVLWLDAAHPEAINAAHPGTAQRLFRVAGQEWILKLDRESLDLLAGYLDEYERSVHT